YSLWAFTLVLACAAFLRAIRMNTVASWVLYCVTTVVSVYTHLFTIPVLGFLGAVLLIWERFRLSRAVLSFTGASVAAGLACIPWFLVLLAGRRTAESSLGW